MNVCVRPNRPTDWGLNWKHIVYAKPHRCILKLITGTQSLTFIITCLIKTVRLPPSSSAGHFLTLQVDRSFIFSPSALCIGCLILSTRLLLFDLQPLENSSHQYFEVCLCVSVNFMSVLVFIFFVVLYERERETCVVLHRV